MKRAIVIHGLWAALALGGCIAPAASETVACGRRYIAPKIAAQLGSATAAPVVDRSTKVRICDPFANPSGPHATS